MEIAAQNRQDIAEIKGKYLSGQISREEAKELALPVIERINKRTIEIAKKYNKKPALQSFIGLMR